MEGSLVNKIDLQAYTLVGPTVTGPVQDPLAVNTSTTDYIW